MFRLFAPTLLTASGLLLGPDVQAAPFMPEPQFGPTGWKVSTSDKHQWGGPRILAADKRIYTEAGESRGRWCCGPGPYGEQYLMLSFDVNDQVYIAWKESGRWVGVYRYSGQAGVWELKIENEQNAGFFGAGGRSLASELKDWSLTTTAGFRWGGSRRLGEDGFIYDEGTQNRGSWVYGRGPDSEKYLLLHFKSDQRFFAWKDGGRWVGIYRWGNSAGDWQFRLAAQK